MKKLYDEPTIFIVLFRQDAICVSGDVEDTEGGWIWGDDTL